MRIFITGASGFIGRRLLRDLLRRGDQVLALTRKASNIDSQKFGAESSGPEGQRLIILEGDPAQTSPWQKQVAGVDAVAALAGEPIFGARWSDAFKRRLHTSRIDGMKRMVEALSQCSPEQRPRILIAASAVGYYGYAEHTDDVISESAAAGQDFLARLCADWEAAAEAASSLGVRVVRLRIGVVLGEGGGALDKMVPAFQAFVGGPLGSGDQYVPWIHLDDVIGLILLALDRSEVRGALNLTAPEPATMRTLAKTIGGTLKRPSLFSVPSLALKLLLGEAAQTLLGSQRVMPKRALELGYAFHYPDLASALRSILGPTRP